MSRTSSPEPPLIVRLDDYEETEERDGIRADLERLLRDYSLTLQHERRALLEQFRLVDLARKVVGVGSVGTRAGIALLLGRDGQDPLFLQIKEAQPSVMEEFAGPSEYRNSGERVVAGQRTMQASSDIFLGWITSTRRHPRRLARLLRSSAARLEGLDRGRSNGPACAVRLRATLLR